jgi:hypothetical protein
MTRAFYRGYADTTTRAGQVKRFHVMREDGTFPGRQGLCGIHGWDVTNSTTQIFDPMPFDPPEGLTWCDPCITRYVEWRGSALLAPVAIQYAIPSPSPDLRVVFMIAAEERYSHS